MMDKLNSTTAITSANVAPKPSETQRKDSSKASNAKKDDGDFSKELSAVVAPQLQQLPNPVSQKQTAAQEVEKAYSLNSGKKFALTSSAEKSPTTRAAAASLNAAEAITGLKPWSREWVFDGNDAISQAQSERSKPLFGGDESPISPVSKDPQAQLKALSAAIAGAQAGLAQQSGTRGNAGAGAAHVKGALDPVAAAKAGQQAGVAAEAETPDVSSLLQQQQPNFVQPSHAAHLASAKFAAAGESVPGLSALNGQVLGVEAQGPQAPGSLPNAQPTQLSGADFMSALGAARMGARGQDSSNLSGDTGGGQSGFGGRGDTANTRSIEEWRKPSSLNGRSDVFFAGVEPLRPGESRMIPPTTVDGHVTQGSMTRNRLTSEALLNMTNGIGNFAAQGGGEMRVRLKPDSLGELHLRVSTRGNDVRLQIQATDDKAKKILEESLPSLKEKLASQNLNLGRVEVSTLAQGHSGSGLHQESQGQGGQSQHMHQQNPMGDWLGQDQGRSGQSPNRWAEYDPAWDTDAPTARATARPGISGLSGAAFSERSSPLESGRLDVRA